MNDLVMTEPFETRGMQVGQTASGLAVSKSHTALTPLKVLADGPDGIRAGDIVYVPGTCSVQPWATKGKMELEGTPCIFIPKSEVKLVRPTPKPPPAPTPVPVQVQVTA
jgi:hypothetical protein